MKEHPPLVIVGFGSQAKAWALNLRDSHISFVIALNPGSHSEKKARDLKMNPVFLNDPIIRNYRTFILLIPDDQHLAFFEANIKFLSSKSHFIYAHGFSLAHYRLHEKYPQFSHSLLAPKAIASEVRFQFETNGKLGGIYYSENPENLSEIFNIAKQVGISALYPAHFEEETMADLFSEQALLCSILPYASLKCYNLLVAHGIPSELAFMECFLELKSIASALVNLGPEEFFKLISPNALIGSEKGRELILNHHFDEALNQIFVDIKNKQFYKQVDLDSHSLREKILNNWKSEELNNVYKRLKSELIS